MSYRLCRTHIDGLTPKTGARKKSAFFLERQILLFSRPDDISVPKVTKPQRFPVRKGSKYNSFFEN